MLCYNTCSKCTALLSALSPGHTKNSSSVDETVVYEGASCSKTHQACFCVRLCLSLCTLLDRLEELTAVRQERQASLKGAELLFKCEFQRQRVRKVECERYTSDIASVEMGVCTRRGSRTDDFQRLCTLSRKTTLLPCRSMRPLCNSERVSPAPSVYGLLVNFPSKASSRLVKSRQTKTQPARLANQSSTTAVFSA